MKTSSKIRKLTPDCTCPPFSQDETISKFQIEDPSIKNLGTPVRLGMMLEQTKRDKLAFDIEREMEHPFFHKRIRKEDHYDTTHLTTFVIGIIVGALLTLTAL